MFEEQKQRKTFYLCWSLLAVGLSARYDVTKSQLSLPTALCNQCLFYATLTISISICIITFSSCSVLSVYIEYVGTFSSLPNSIFK